MKVFAQKSSISGQMLVEVVVAVSVITLILVALVSAITFSLANVQFARNKALATKYAQEAVEWLRSERDAGWYTFNSYAPDSGATYCMNTFTYTLGSCAGAVIDDAYDIFQREVTLSGNAADDRITITVVVYWTQGQRTEQVVHTTYLTRWI